jgi:hypothetical protein
LELTVVKPKDHAARSKANRTNQQQIWTKQRTSQYAEIQAINHLSQIQHPKRKHITTQAHLSLSSLKQDQSMCVKLRNSGIQDNVYESITK